MQVAIVETREANYASPAPAATKVLTVAGRALHWHRIQHHDVCTTAGLEVAAVAACDLQRHHPMLLNLYTPFALQPQRAEQVAVFENERFLPLRGWSSGNLLPTDRKRYSGPGSRNATEFPSVALEPGELRMQDQDGYIS